VKKPKVQSRRPVPREVGIIRQAVKTSAAATLSLYLAGLFGLPEPYWGAVSAIIVMQSDLGTLETASINRLAGTAIGAMVGALAVSFWGSSLWSFGAAVLCAILFCAVVGRWETYRFAGVTVSIVMLVAHHGTSWMVALHRFLEVSFGILVAFLVAMADSRLPWGGNRRPVPSKSRFSAERKARLKNPSGPAGHRIFRQGRNGAGSRKTGP
jgi:uncharacterized membrane protein YccC